MGFYKLSCMSWLFKYSTSQIKDFLETKVFFLFSCFFCFSFILISQFAKWTETELYPVHSSKYLFSGFDYEFLFALKPLFYSLLKVFSLFAALLPFDPMSLARCFFALNGLILLYFFYLYLEKKTNRYNAVLALLILASTYILLNRGFRVRSDMLSSSLSFFILWINLNWKSDKKKSVLLFLFLSLLFITPKAIYWMLLNLLLLENHTRQTLFKKLSLNLLLNSGLFVIGMSLFFKDPFFIKSIYESGKFYLLSVKLSYTSFIEKGFIETLPSFFVSHFIDRNYFFFFLIGLKLCSSIYQLIEKKRMTKQNWYFLILLGITFLHPDSKLVFFSALSPFFMIAFFTDPIWLKIVNQSYSEKFKVILLGWFFIYSFSYISYFSYKTITHKNNLAQKRMVGSLNKFYKDTPSNLNILDPACLIYSRKTTCKYLLYQEKFDQAKYVKENNFDIILSSYYLSLFYLLLGNESNIQYVSVKNHILSKAFVIDAKLFHDLKEDSAIKLNKILKLDQNIKQKGNKPDDLDQNIKQKGNTPDGLDQNIKQKGNKPDDLDQNIKQKGNNGLDQNIKQKGNTPDGLDQNIKQKGNTPDGLDQNIKQKGKLLKIKI